MGVPHCTLFRASGAPAGMGMAGIYACFTTAFC